jgi:hypothetical protein
VCRTTLASSLGLLKETGEIIQVFCRWRAAESVREYNHITPDVYADKVAAAMRVDASQNPKGVPHIITDDDDAMSVLQAEVSDMDGTSLKSTTAPATRSRGDAGRAPAARAERAVYQQLKKSPAKGMVVMVPASIWPTETCHENDGGGWLAKVVSCHGDAASLCFETARTADGRPYENVRLDWRHLQQNVTG